MNKNYEQNFALKNNCKQKNLIWSYMYVNMYVYVLLRDGYDGYHTVFDNLFRAKCTYYSFKKSAVADYRIKCTLLHN